MTTTTTSSTGSNAASGGEVVHEAEHPGRLAVNATEVAVESSTRMSPPRPRCAPHHPVHHGCGGCRIPSSALHRAQAALRRSEISSVALGFKLTFCFDFFSCNGK
jgi:hypothetical protein